MGLEINRYDGRNTPQEIIDAYKIRAEINEEVRKAQETKAAKEEKDKKAELDTYKKKLVSDTIEQQIKEQKAKIDEISKNLEVLRAEYTEAAEKEDEARAERRIKARELYKKEISESSLKRMFNNWRSKYLANQTDKKIESQYKTYNLDYDTAVQERIDADKDYDLSDTDAYTAIMDSNSADAAFLGGLWNKRDAYWDLAKLQQNLGFAKAVEGHYNL